MLALAGCAADGQPETPEPPDPPIVGELRLEQCLVGGGRLVPAWSVSNQHGPVTSMASTPTRIVLGSADGSVKQWSLNGEGATYGDTFRGTTGIAVGGLAIARDGALLGADDSGKLSEWSLADASPMRSTPVIDGPLRIVAIEEHSRVVAAARGPDASEIWAIDRALTEHGAPLNTRLWGVSSVVFGHGRHLFTSGHSYSVPTIERRSIDNADQVLDAWSERSRVGNVHAIAVDPYVTRMAVAGSNFVGAFDPNQLEAGAHVIRMLDDHEPIAVAYVGRDLFVTAGREGTLRVWDAVTVEPRGSLAIPPPVSVVLGGDGELLFTSGSDGKLHAFDCE